MSCVNQVVDLAVPHNDILLAGSITITMSYSMYRNSLRIDRHVIKLTVIQGLKIKKLHRKLNNIALQTA